MDGGDRANRPLFSCIIKNGTHEKPIYGMFDSGCSSAVLLFRVSESIHIVTVPHYCRLNTFDEDKYGIRDFASFEVLSMDRSVRFRVKNALVGDLLTTENERPPTNQDILPFK